MNHTTGHLARVVLETLDQTAHDFGRGRCLGGHDAQPFGPRCPKRDATSAIDCPQTTDEAAETDEQRPNSTGVVGSLHPLLAVCATHRSA